MYPSASGAAIASSDAADDRPIPAYRAMLALTSETL